MAVKRVTTKYPGVRYKEHPTRKNGIMKDRYFSIYYWRDGKKKEEGLGWASKGMTAQKASLILGELGEAKTKGEGPQTLREKRAIEKARREAEDIQKKKENDDAKTIGHIFTSSYSPLSNANKSTKSCEREENLWKLWIDPVIGSMPIKEISPLHLERIKQNMADAGKAARSITYALAVVRQVINHALNIGIYDGGNPVSRVKKPTADNRRLRFLSHDEADNLLASLREKSIDIHNMALLSLHTGMRAGEIFSLTWGDVDLNRGILTLRDTKSGKNRFAYMTDTIKEMFKGMKEGTNDKFVFPNKKESEINRVSNTFNRAVNELDLNKGVTDPRQKVVFHSLRHTFASWLVESGVDLYQVKTLLGHATIALTERYSHLSERALTEAVRTFERGMQKPV